MLRQCEWFLKEQNHMIYVGWSEIGSTIQNIRENNCARHWELPRCYALWLCQALAWALGTSCVALFVSINDIIMFLGSNSYVFSWIWLLLDIYWINNSWLKIWLDKKYNS